MGKWQWKKQWSRLLACLLLLTMGGCSVQEQHWEIWLDVHRVPSLSVGLWQVLCGMVPTSPYSQLYSGVPLLQGQSASRQMGEAEAYQASALVADTWEHRFEKVKEGTIGGETKVLLYHTHNAETYRGTAGVSKVTGENGGVVQAAAVLQRALQEQHGVPTVHSTAIHDYPNWNRAYQNSLLTAQQLLAANPQAEAIFDVHRDAGFPDKKTTTTTIQGRSAARILLVIGANHAHWKENLAFARRLEQVCKVRYPGLLREQIRIRETGRYNQQLSSRCVLLEIGSDWNTQEEANYAMECFAEVIAEVLRHSDR